MDIIHQLEACNLFFIVEQIFNYLDLHSRTRISCVSKTWQRIFHYVKFHRIIRVRQQNEPALFSSFAVCKQICLSHETLDLESEHVRCCAMNDQWIAAGCQSGRIFVWNRQTLRRQTVSPARNDKPVTSLRIHSGVLMAGFQEGFVCIWDAKTFHLLQQIEVSLKNIH